ncbi:ATP-binding protein [Ktedonospora formicarum]|uniref:histidine kinase n=1 Tax=Ktedonospora formicarum TaxID=2778364 RepID=A0A8J3MQN8_9CHLR|nr:GAF domain-containing protein [Ktedonospora formicarum]GHO42971.1 hypothetical protein KSX_11340 [Ktedonospora formicarum]
MDARTNTSTVEESAIIERVIRIVTSVRDAKPNYALLAAELEQAIPFDVFGVVLLRHDRQAVRVAVCRREGREWRVFPHQHPLQGSMLEQVLGSPMLMVNNYPDGLDGPPGETGDALSGQAQLRSTVIAPLVLEDKRVLGALELGSVGLNTYADTTLQRLIDGVAKVLAAAIERAQLGGSAVIYDRQRQALQDVSSALTSRIDLPTILSRIVAGIASALNVSSAIIMLGQREGRMRLEAQKGLDAKRLQRIVSQKSLSDFCILSQTLRTQTRLVSDNIATDVRFPMSRFFAEELGMLSILCYPLVSGTTVLGALLLCAPDAGGFTPLKVEILSLFASQATFAIHNGMLLESAHQRSRFQRALEQLERAHVLQRNEEPTSAEVKAARAAEDLTLIEQLREETERTYGISLQSILRFVGNHLLTKEEWNWQSMIYADLAEQGLPGESHLLEALTKEREDSSQIPFAVERDEAGEESAAVRWLTRTAETALEETGWLGELSRLIERENGKDDAWIVVDINGYCLYLNPNAQALCDAQLAGSMNKLADVYSVYNSPFWLARRQQQEGVITLENAFSGLLSRTRNADEVRHYLQSFVQGLGYAQGVRCAVMAHPERENTSMTNRRHTRREMESMSTDYYYHLRRHELFADDGHLISYVLQARDVTEQARDERNRSALLSSVSHDLRTPLTTIKAAVTGLLQEDLEWDEADRRILLGDIESETDHLSVLVNALVELSRIEMGALVLQHSWCEVAEVIHGALVKLNRVASEHHIEIILPDVSLMAYVDHVQLERVFYNLIENAARHSPPQSTVTVRAEKVEDSLRVSVIGYNISGIPEEESERVFTAFYSSRTYGNGLSLAICKGIIDAHQGKIWVETTKEDVTKRIGEVSDERGGTGLCFIFTVPLYPHARISLEQEHQPGFAHTRNRMDPMDAIAQPVQEVVQENHHES